MTTITFSKTILIEFLRKFICEIKFIKTNGDLRVMKCTLLPDYIGIPLDTKDRQTTITRPNNVIRVFDLELKQWRSFKPETVQSIEILGSSND